MKTTFKAWLLSCPGFEAACRMMTRRHVRAVMYHRFSDEATGDPRKVDRTTLVTQASHILRHHTPWSPDQHLAALRGDLWPGGRCPVVITVDDGYQDFGNVAHPIFREHGLPAMLFVVTGFVGGETWFWWDRLEFILDAAEASEHTIAIANQDLDLDLRTRTGRKRAWHVIADHGRFLADHEKEDLIGQVARALAVEIPATPPPGYEALDWEQIRELHADGALFGAHTCGHPILSRIPLLEAEREIEDSRERLAHELGEPVSWFCYPQGGPADWTREVREVVARSFSGCYLAYQTLENPADPYTMPRYCVSPDMVGFRWALCGAEYLVLRLKQLLRRNTGVGRSYWGQRPERPHREPLERQS